MNVIIRKWRGHGWIVCLLTDDEYERSKHAHKRVADRLGVCLCRLSDSDTPIEFRTEQEAIDWWKAGADMTVPEAA